MAATQESPDNLFQYQQLTDPTKETRLLKLIPSTNDKPIECELIHVDRNTEPKDDCLSYTWGETYHLQSIAVNGRYLKVTENLAATLRRLRNWKHEKYHGAGLIWIDAICINQADDVERGHQVGSMKEIYRDAAQVIAWLLEKKPRRASTFSGGLRI